MVTIQVITSAWNPLTGREKEFPNPGNVPLWWIKGEAPEGVKRFAGPAIAVGLALLVFGGDW